MKLMVFGAGYVGLVQGAGLASTGNSVYLIDVLKDRIDTLKAGKCPIYEPGLEELLQTGVQKKHLSFLHTEEPEFYQRMAESKILFIAVGTPEGTDNMPTLDFLYGALDMIAQLEGDLADKIVVTKSTVPVGTGDKIEKYLKDKGKFPVVASNPEFLKQGSSVQDFLKPERVIIGTEDERAREVLAELHHPFMMRQDRVLCMSRRSAELVKYACNAFLATKISFINEMAQLSEAVGADVREIRSGMISDSRIGSQFLFPGIGYGGSCFPKDTHALIAQGETFGVPMGISKAADQVNQKQRLWAFEKLQKHFEGDLAGKTIAIWGLSFKPNTDDLREAPSVPLISRLVEAGAQIKAHDPVAMSKAKEWLQPALDSGKLTLVDEPYEAASGADALAVLTEWQEFRSPDFDQLAKIMKKPVLLDGRNIYHTKMLTDFDCYSVGVA